MQVLGWQESKIQLVRSTSLRHATFYTIGSDASKEEEDNDDFYNAASFIINTIFPSYSFQGNVLNDAAKVVDTVTGGNAKTQVNTAPLMVPLTLIQGAAAKGAVCLDGSLPAYHLYPVIPTLLTRIFWWRVCLDEAQMVECNTANATDLALRLHAKYHWCNTGTPIQRRLDDLYGLLKFLRASPFDVRRWWLEVIKDPYERRDHGSLEFAHKFFKQIMWRSMKVHVADELELPPQDECVCWLFLSPIEAHFYQKQHETCSNYAHELIKSLREDAHKNNSQCSQWNDALCDTTLTQAEAAKLLNSLLKLRQACCHPQVGSSGLRSLQHSLRSLQHAPMTMEEVLGVLVGKAKLEGEEALRISVMSLNALAGIAVIKGEIPEAVSLYRESLTLAEEHCDDFQLDPLVNLHIHYNLAEIFADTAGILNEVQLCSS
ncbi:RING-type E3 ubiquitin transferase [Ranunculus cassubicifolius]